MSKINFLAKNQAYFTEGNKTVFQSYNTIICTIENGNVTITEGQPQSTTTAKYLNKFLKLHVGVSNYKTLLKK
jgi:hypothetical protein